VFKIVTRYNDGGPDALGNRRQNNPGATPLLTAELAQELDKALQNPPPDVDGIRFPSAQLALGTHRGHAPFLHFSAIVVVDGGGGLSPPSRKSVVATCTAVMPSAQCPAVSTTSGAISTPVQPTSPRKYTAAASSQSPDCTRSPPTMGGGVPVSARTGSQAAIHNNTHGIKTNRSAVPYECLDVVTCYQYY
jgi:hypothetical protein